MLTCVAVLHAQRPLSAHADAPSSTRLSTQQLLADTMFFPEGLDVDARSGALFVTSIATGRIVRVDASGALRDVFARDAAPLAGVFGVAVDTICECLWVTTAPHPRRDATLHARISHTLPDGGVRVADSTAALLQVRLADGVVLRRFPLGDGTGMPGELSTTPTGDVLVSDGVRGRLYRLRSGGHALEEIRDSLLRSPQGIAVRGDGRVAWIADWSRGVLRWDLTTDHITRVHATQTMELRGIDGLRAHDAWLIGVQNGTSTARVIGLRTDDTGTSITAVHVLDELSAWIGEPTVGAVLGDHFVYVATSQWPFWTASGTRRGDAPLPTVQLRRVPIAFPR